MTPELDVVTNAAFLDKIEDRDMEELRAMRSRCQSLENSLSYVRRLIQGRLDIIGAEVTRRSQGGDEGDASDLIGRLPEVLSEGSRTGGGPGSVRPPTSMEPDPEVTAALESKADALIAGERLSAAFELSDDELQQGLTGLSALEDDVSSSRRDLHGVIDGIQAEVTRRYAAGLVNVDGLLSR